MTDMHPVEIFLNGILDFLRGSKEKLVKIEDVKAYKDVVSKIDSPELKNSDVVKDFKNSTVTMNKKEGDTYNIYITANNPDEILGKLIERLKEEKDKADTEKVSVFPAEDKANYLEFKDEIKPLKKDYIGVYELLNDRHKALLALAIDIKRHYSKKEPDVADAAKKSTAEKYGDYGIKFCNLWNQGYLQNIFSLLAENIKTDSSNKTDMNDAVNGFIMEADSIEFVHTHSDVAKTA